MFFFDILLYPSIKSYVGMEPSEYKPRCESLTPLYRSRRRRTRPRGYTSWTEIVDTRGCNEPNEYRFEHFVRIEVHKMQTH